jgi:pimeloyl-ACP methyl ester carboxylesterase
MAVLVGVGAAHGQSCPGSCGDADGHNWSLQLYYELRGSGPPLLLIMGATGDGGRFAKLPTSWPKTRMLTYDRRGNSRSTCPAFWDSTTAEEQADDAAGLLCALELARAGVFGTSSGAICALSLLIRHPELTGAGILHDPPMLSVVERGGDVLAAIAELVEAGVATGGPPAGLERFWRFVAGNLNWEALDPDLRERMLGNAKTFLSVERTLAPRRRVPFL